LGRNGLPARPTVDAICRVADEVKPDLIHVWGTESYWGLLTARGILPGPAVLEVQGIKYACARVFQGGLSLTDRVGCVGPLEILRPNTHMASAKRRFERWGRFEREMMLGHQYISTQSDWVRSQVRAVNPRCHLFSTGIMLRPAFLEAGAWTAAKDRVGPTVFASSSGSFPYKGLHVLIRALAILKRKHPTMVAKIAGDIMRKGIRQSGYARWLQREVCRLSLCDNVQWLGPLEAKEIILQLQHASAVVIPSYIETYSLALAEAMAVGTPAVVSYVGAMPELARDEESALFFPPGDELACARQLDRVLCDPSLAEHLSRNARRIGLSRNDPHTVLQRQLNIYDEIFGGTTRLEQHP